MTAPLRPDKPSLAATRFARRLEAVCRGEARRLGLKGKNARVVRDHLKAKALADIGKQLEG